MKHQGGFVSGEIIILGAAALAVIFGIYKYSSAENNDFKDVLQSVNSCRGDIKSLDLKFKDFSRWNEDQGKEIEALRQVVLELQKKVGDFEGDVGDAQEHLARLRESQIYLDGKTRSSQVEIKLQTPSGPIPIQILESVPKKKIVTRKTAVKTKDGYRTRTETRQSPLKGNPDALPQKKKKKVLKKKRSLQKSKVK